MGVLCTLGSQPTHLVHEPAVLHAQGSGLTTRGRELLSEDREDRAKARQPVEKMIAVNPTNSRW